MRKADSHQLVEILHPCQSRHMAYTFAHQPVTTRNAPSRLKPINATPEIFQAHRVTRDQRVWLCVQINAFTVTPDAHQGAIWKQSASEIGIANLKHASTQFDGASIAYCELLKSKA